MRGYFGLGQLSATEKSDILNQHKSVYNGYQTMQPQVSNTQPLYVFDSAGDKDGLVVNNKGEVKKYSNMGINEEVEEKEMCEQCGGRMTEGICEQCGPNEEIDEKFDKEKFKKGLKDFGRSAKSIGSAIIGIPTYDHTDDETGDWKKDKAGKDYDMYSYYNKQGADIEEGEGKLDDIYNQEDLNPDAGFDYMQGPSNSVDTFEKMHKNLYKEDEYDTDNKDDAVVGSEDLQIDSSEMYEDETDGKPYEMGKRGMKASRARSSFTPTPQENEILNNLFGQYGEDIPPIVIRYLRKLPRKTLLNRLVRVGLIDKDLLKGNETIDEQGGNAPDIDVSSVDSAYDFVSQGPGEVYPNEEELDEYETMESAFSDEMDEVDVSGSQGIYGEMDSPYDFDSEGPGKAGPYQRSNYNEDDMEEEYSEQDETYDIDEDLKESFLAQKNKINEMMNRMKKFK
jgi:hypothetical protein